MVSPFKIAVVGLGYVGLPLAVEFSKKYDVLGFDIDENRVNELCRGEDHTREASLDNLSEVLKTSKEGKNVGLRLSYDPDDLRGCNIYIVAVPTPIDQFKAPNLVPLLKATEMLGKVLEKGDIVIYESTVYPGCTEEDCVPVLEKYSGLVYNTDFFCGYSPERINPGDKVNTLINIKKVTSGSNARTAEIVDELYRSIIIAGTHKASSIKVAEASKAIENAQRDINISFVNELALIFDRMGIDTNEVIEAAASKWNFLKFKPGLVGGHCIGVDPYYLVHKAESLGYHPQVILSGRRVNDNMGMFIANKVIKLMIRKGHKIDGAKALILGFTFKENCPDVRNSRVIDIYRELIQFGLKVDIFDPQANKVQAEQDYQITLIPHLEHKYDVIILAVAHEEFKYLDYDKLKLDHRAVIFDTKAILNTAIVDARL